MIALAAALLTSLASTADQPAPDQPAATSPSPLDRIVDPAAGIERLGEDAEFRFLEGPVWVPGTGSAPGYLLFSDIPNDTIHKWTPGESGGSGTVSVLFKPSRNSNGLMIDAQGRLLVCEHQRRLVRFDTIAPDAAPVVLAEKYDDKRLNSPNDLDIHSDGSIVFTDPPYGLNPTLGKAGEKELDFHGVFRLAPDGKLSLLTRDLRMPNGLAFSPDEKLLYVADMGKSEIRVFDVKPDGSIDNNRLFAELKSEQGGGRGMGGDGVRVDTEGNVYVAARSGVWVFDPKGARLGVIPVPMSPANLCFGGDDMKTMFITAQRGLYRLPVKIPGKR
jgi:sugar lactone lactonase YvrE